jgi:hypothetical membrane protein
VVSQPGRYVLASPSAESVAKLGGVLLILAGAAILMGIITGEALFPVAYRTARNTISDLGSTWQPGNIVREPSATIFNTTMLITGLMLTAGAMCSWCAYRARGVAIGLSLLGLGVVGVGIFHGTEIGGHFSNDGLRPVFSILAFVAGSITAILAYRVTTDPVRYVSVLLGTAALLSLVLSGPLGDTKLGVGE